MGWNVGGEDVVGCDEMRVEVRGWKIEDGVEDEVRVVIVRRMKVKVDEGEVGKRGFGVVEDVFEVDGRRVG